MLNHYLEVVKGRSSCDLAEEETGMALKDGMGECRGSALRKDAYYCCMIVVCCSIQSGEEI